MENVVLTVHLILALALIGVVLMQRSEGGGLGMGGGGVVSGRAAGTALGKVTWGLAIAFICTSIALTVLARQNAAATSVIDTTGGAGAPATPAAPGSSLLPPGPADQPLTPPRVD